MRGSKVRRIGHDLWQGEPAILAAKIIDFMPPHANGARSVIATPCLHCTKIKRHGSGQQLESGTRFINAHRHAIEAFINGRSTNIIGIVIGQAHHAENLARMDIHHHAGAANAVEISNRVLHGIAQSQLHTDIK